MILEGGLKKISKRFLVAFPRPEVSKQCGKHDSIRTRHLDVLFLPLGQTASRLNCHEAFDGEHPGPQIWVKVISP